MTCVNVDGHRYRQAARLGGQSLAEHLSQVSVHINFMHVKPDSPGNSCNSGGHAHCPLAARVSTTLYVDWLAQVLLNTGISLLVLIT
jgi:hypothetical protein